MRIKKKMMMMIVMIMIIISHRVGTDEMAGVSLRRKEEKGREKLAAWS